MFHRKLIHIANDISTVTSLDNSNLKKDINKFFLICIFGILKFLRVLKKFKLSRFASYRYYNIDCNRYALTLFVDRCNSSHLPYDVRISVIKHINIFRVAPVP